MSSLNKRTFGRLGVAIAGVIAVLSPRAHGQDWIRQFGTIESDAAYGLAPDGAVDALDIEFFIDILFNGATPCNTCTGDTNGDGNIDAADIEGFINCLFQ